MTDAFRKFADNVSDRGQRIYDGMNELIARRASGEVISDESWIRAHPELMPELAEGLRKLHLVLKAA